MSSDSYKIQIIHYYNPHLIWVEVKSKSSKKKDTFEQIGIYGILPHEVTLSLDQEQGSVGLSSSKCSEWVPAAKNLMKEFLLDAKETWFCPVYIDHRTSIFDDNIHKYGEIIIKSRDGELRQLSDFLIQSAFALRNTCEFHNFLFSGKLKTKLTNYMQVRDVVQHLEAYCGKDKSSINKITTVAKKIVELQQDLTDLHLDKYNKGFLNIVRQKMNDLDLSKDIEEESLGRACTKKKENDNNVNNHNEDTPYVIKNYFQQLKSSQESTSESEVTDVLQHQEGDLQNEQVTNHEMSKKLSLLKKLSQIKSNHISIEKNTLNYGQDFPNTSSTQSSIPNVQVEHKEKEHQSKEDRKVEKKCLESNFPDVIKDVQINQENEVNSVQENGRMSLMRKKLTLLKKTAHKESDSDVSNQGTKNDTFDDELDDIMKQINTAYPNTKLRVDRNGLQELKDNFNKSDIDVNNLSSQMCNFVDKIVTPVVMVHSKSNKTIKPIFTLRDIPFNEHIHIVLKHMMINRAMALQSISWLTILRGHSLFMIGPKESGKTMGYLPCVCRLVSDGTPEVVGSVGPICIIVCATSESVTEVEKIARMLLGLNEKILACYAGVDDMLITTSLLNRCDLLISTPPMLARLLQDSDFGVDLRRLRTFVLDDCERLEEVYKKEVKFFHHKIKELEKSRANKELKVQYIIASRVWCDFMEPLAKKAPDTVIGIGAFPECILYSKTNMAVNFVEESEKLRSVFEFFNEIDISKKVVIVCRYNDEVEHLEKALKCLNNYIFACHSDMSLSHLYNLNAAWNEYNVPLIGPILICTDENLSHLNVTDAHYLVHYSLPKAYSFFKRRFSVLNDNYPSIFHSDRQSVKVKILLEELNTEKLPKILNFIKRCTDVPLCLDEICQKVLAVKDVSKAKKFVPICGGLLALGYCPEFYDCQGRHKVLKDYDEPSSWIPKSGGITFTILHFHSATNYSARLLTHFENGNNTKFPPTYTTLSVKLGMYFGKASNRKLHGIPKLGDICAVSVKQDLFARCQVVKILSVYQRGNPNYVLIRLLDEEKYERTRDIYLYHLPKELVAIDTHVVQIRLANVQPKDKDVTFSALAKDHVKKLVSDEDDLHVRGRIAGVIGNCIFVDTLEVCRDLSSLDEIVVKYDLKRELLEKHAEVYLDHIKKLKELCTQNNFSMTNEQQSVEIKKRQKKNTGYWAHLEHGEVTGVYVTSVINPGEFFMRLSKFEPCVNLLLKDIKKHVDTYSEPLKDIEVGDIVLAKFPEDETYERARVDSNNSNLIKCFFVDQGDWANVSAEHILPITDKLINQLPFQSIECSLIGVEPPGNTWTDFCNNWFSNYSDEGTKHLYAQYFTKKPAKITGGYKYSIGLIDTNTSSDIIINQLMIDLNLAQMVEDEIHYLDDIIPTVEKTEAVDEEDDWENVSEIQDKPSSPKNDSPNVPLSKIFLPQPIRSVPLVTSDCESENSDPWEIQNADSFLSHFKMLNRPQGLDENTFNEKQKSNKSLPALTLPNYQSNEDNRTSSSEYEFLSMGGRQPIPTELPLNDNDVQRSNKFQVISKHVESELDSDDTVTSAPKANSNDLTIIDETRKPKLIWRQNKTSVNIKIQLIGVEKYDLSIDDRTIKFATFLHDTKYSFDFDLYAVINKKQCSHSNKGQYILVKLTKVLHKNWLTLTKDPELKKWIVYDVDGLEASSEEETVDDSVVKIAKEMHEKHETDSDDDDIVDDIDYRYK